MDLGHMRKNTLYLTKCLRYIRDLQDSSAKEPVRRLLCLSFFYFRLSRLHATCRQPMLCHLLFIYPTTMVKNQHNKEANHLCP